MDWAKATARRDEIHLSFVILFLDFTVYTTLGAPKPMKTHAVALLMCPQAAKHFLTAPSVVDIYIFVDPLFVAEFYIATMK